MGLSVLVCAVLATMALGVLMAYSICYLMFALFKIHARRIADRSSGLIAPQVAGS